MALKRLRLKTRAKAYAADLGWPVVPMHNIVDGHCSCSLGQECSRPGKHPRTQHGAKDASTDLVQIKRWWRKWPDANVGIVVGEAAQIIVLDIDPRNGGSETLKALEGDLGALPETVTAETGGGGLHFVFEHPALPVAKDSAGKLLGPGIDVLASGAIMVASPSKHSSGNRYRWATGKSHKHLRPAKLPEAWIQRLCATAASAGDVTQAAASQAITQGGRNTALTNIAGQLHRANLSPEAIRAAVLEENRTKCSPPLDAAEVERIVASVARYASGPGGDRTDPAEQLLDIVLNNYFDGGRHLKFAADGQFWHYTGKLWEPVAKAWIEGRILEASKGNPIRTSQRTASLLHQVRALLEAKLATTGDPLSFLAEPPPVINCANGEVWIGANGVVELRPHRPESCLCHCLDVTYDPEAGCPEYDRAVREIFALAQDPKDLVRHWNDLFGYIIQPRRRIPVIPILLGGGDNGKTKLMHTVMKLLGRDLVHAQRVDDLEKNRFTMGSLFGKRLFVDDDVRAGVRLPDGILKTISEEKEVTGDQKFKPPFNFTMRIVPVLLCNNIPSLADLSHGMIRRLMVIPFDRTFSEAEKDADLFLRIWANELPGVLNRALAGYRRVLARGSKFDRPKAVRLATRRLVQQANPLPAFINDCYDKNTTGHCLLRDFYAAYSHWTQEMGFTLTQTQPVVRRNLEHLGYTIQHGNQGDKVVGMKKKATKGGYKGNL